MKKTQKVLDILKKLDNSFEVVKSDFDSLKKEEAERLISELDCLPGKSFFDSKVYCKSIVNTLPTYF